MKKLLIVFVVLSCIVLCACGSSIAQETTEPPKKTIPLTTSNFEEYFNIECSVEDFTKEYYKNIQGCVGYADCKVTVDQVKPGTLSDVKVVLKVSTPSLAWEEEETLTIYVPINGSTSKSFSWKSILCSTAVYTPMEPILNDYILEVSGTISVSD